MKKMKAHFYRWQGNRQLSSLKAEQAKNSNLRESLLDDFAKLDAALDDLHDKYSLATGPEAQEIAEKITQYELARREMMIIFNQIIERMDSLKEEAAALERQFRTLEAVMDEKQG